MNPWAFIVIGLGVILIIIGFKGSQHEVLSALTGNNVTSRTKKQVSKTSGSVM